MIGRPPYRTAKLGLGAFQKSLTLRRWRNLYDMKLPRRALYVFLLYTAAVCGQQRPVPLGSNVVDIAYSGAVDRLLVIYENRTRLEIFNPASRSLEVSVTLPSTPLAISVSPDGTHVAILHTTLISYINLLERSMERVYTIPSWSFGSSDGIVLSGDWIYAADRSVHISDAQISISPTASPTARLSRSSALARNGQSIYTGNGLDLYVIDIAGGPMATSVSSGYRRSGLSCNSWWLSRDSERAIVDCGVVFSTAKDGFAFHSQIPLVTSFASISEAPQGLLAATTVGPFSYPGSDPAIIQLFDGPDERPAGRLRLPEGYSGHWLHFDRTGGDLYVVMRNATSYFLYTFHLASPEPCFASFNGTQALSHASPAGEPGAIDVAAVSDCVYRPESSAPEWIEVLSGYGSGNSTVRYLVRPNPSSEPRSGEIRIGSQTFAITQDGVLAESATSSEGALSIRVAVAGYSRASETLVLGSAEPAELDLYDGATGVTKAIIPLNRRPISLSVAPDGLYAAVGHEGWVSYVNLDTGQVERYIKVPAEARSIVLAANGYFYFADELRANIYSYNLQAPPDQEPLTRIKSEFLVDQLAIGTSGKDVPVLYAPSQLGLASYSLEAGVPSNPLFLNSPVCEKVWPMVDAGRVVTGCGAVAGPFGSGGPAQPYPLAAGANLLRHADSYGGNPEIIAVLPAYTGSEVRIYGADDLRLRAARPLPGSGRFVFWSGDGSHLNVISETESGVFRSSWITAETCDYMLSAPAVSVPWEGTAVRIDVTVAPGCRWIPYIDNSWLHADSSWLTYDGSGFFILRANPNPYPYEQTTIVTVGSQSLVYTLAANPGVISVPAVSVEIPKQGGAFFVPITASNRYVMWEVAPRGNESIYFPAVGPYSGSASLQGHAEANPPGSLARSLTVLVNDQLLELRQAGEPGPSVSPALIRAPAVGESYELVVTAPATWSVGTPDVPWLSIAGTSGNTIRIVVAAVPKDSAYVAGSRRYGQFAVGGATVVVAQEIAK